MKLKNKWKLLVFVLLLVIGVGYAALSANLKIAGTSGVKSNKWIIYFDRIQNESGVVSTETKITDDKQEVDFNITLNKPGDYYEFDVDTVNDGTIDAMIDSVEFGELDDSVKDLVTFDVTYKDGTEIKKCDLLEKESRKTITVKVNYRDDLTQDDLLDEDKSLNLTFTINYVQKSVCENYPSIIVDPNGGTYNGSNKLTEIKADKNSDNLLDAPEREGYEFLYFKKSDGTTLEKDANGKTNVHVESSDVKVIAEWQEDNTPRYTVTIDPNGGFYKASSTNTEINLVEGETLTLENPIKDGYIFDSWEEITETNSLSENTVTMPAANVTVKAIWKTEADYVARINTKYYTTIQKAFDAAVTDDKVYLLKSTTENATNIKDISFDLGGFTVTGTITNSGTLTIDNGRISNTESSPFVNTGTVNVGTHDGNMIADSIVIFGGSDVNGLTQNGTFNFYDGYIEGKIAVTDIYNELEEGYYYIVDHDDDNNCQKAYLSPEIDAIVKKVINNKDIYYKLLQDAVDASTNANPNIYAIKNFRDSHETTIGNNQNILLDIAGYTVEEGAAIINNGTLTIKDSAETKGSMGVREQVVNNGTINLKDISLSQLDNNKILLENSGDLNIENSTLTGSNSYALNIKTGGDLVFDSTTSINVTNSSTLAIHNESSDAVTITGGNIYSIENVGESLTVNNSSISGGISSTRGILNLNNLNVSSPYSCVSASGKALNINGGTYNCYYEAVNANTNTNNISNATLSSQTRFALVSGGTTVLNNNTITQAALGYVDYNYAISNNGTLTINKNDIIGEANAIANSGTLIINNEANILGKTGRALSSEGIVTINGGQIKSISESTIYTNTSSSLTMNGGTIISENDKGMYAHGNVTILGGTIKGKTYGIHGSLVNLVIGNKEDSLNIETPVIIGEMYGVYFEYRSAEFYDGILKGKTAGYYGDFTKILEKHQIINGTEEIDGETYNTSYLVPQKLFIQVGNDKFNSIQDAIDAVGTSGTMKLIDTASISESSSIPSGSTITFDLNGYTLTNTDRIINNGTLTIEDNTQDKKGELDAVNNDIVENKSILLIKSGNYKTNNNYIINSNSNSTTTIENGNFESYSAIISSSYSTTIIKNGKYNMKSATPVIYSYNGAVQIDGGTFTNTSGSSDSITINVPGNTTINGGTFINEAGNTMVIENGGITINNAIVESVNGNAISVSAGASVINNCTAHSVNGNAINIYRGGLTIEDGTYTSDNNTAFENYGDNTYIKGGTYKGKIYGLYGGGNYTQIGEDDETVKTDSPVFIGETAGIKTRTSPMNFYDGIIKGKENNYEDEFTSVPDGYVIHDDTEVIDGETYQTAYLMQLTPFLKVGNQTFSSMQKAIDAIESVGTIEVIENGFIGRNSTIPSTKEIILDLNGKKITTTQTITIEGKLTAKDSSGDNSGKIHSNNGAYIFTNTNDLIIESGTYEENTNQNSAGVIRQVGTSGQTTINGGIINTPMGNTILVEIGTLEINDGEVFGSYSALSLNSNTHTNINGGTITSNAYSIRAGYRAGNIELNITDGTIHGGYYAISGDYDSSYNVNVSGGTLTGTENEAITGGNLTITGGTIISEKSSGISTGGNIIIGNDEGNVSTTSPVIIGETYGVYDLWNNMYFYDGIIKGKTAGYYSNPKGFATDYMVKFDTEEIDGETYNTAYLVPQTNIIRNVTQNKTYTNFKNAFQEVENNDELIMVDDAISYFEETIPDKKITLNLDGHSIDFIRTMNNNGNVTIKDDNNTEKGTLKTTQSINIINNTNKITINDISASTTSGSTLIRNTGEVTMDNVTVNKDMLVLSNMGGTASISNSTLYGGISNTDGSVLTLTSNNFNTNRNSYNIYNYDSTFTLTGGTMTANGNGIYTNINDSTIKPTVNGVNITSGTICNNTGKLEITGTNIYTSNVYNGANGNLTMNTITQTSNGDYNNKIIQNLGTISLTDYNVTGIDGTIFENSGTAILTNFTGNISRTYNSSYGIIGLNNRGTLTFNSGTLNLEYGSSTYGIYNSDGVMNFINGEININNTSEAYGVYVTGGSITIGVNEDPVSVSTTNPKVTAIGTTTGIGIKKTSGQVNYYDGIITGSLEAIPEAPTDIPNRYRIVLQSVPNDNNYDVRILEYVP